MNQEYFEKWTEMTQNVQKPLQALIDLNIKTLQNLSYLKPEELVHLKKPEEVLEKNVAIAIENGHKTLDYLKKSFELMENTLLSMHDLVKHSSSPMMDATHLGTSLAESKMSQSMNNLTQTALNSTTPLMKAARAAMDSLTPFDPTKPSKDVPKPLFDQVVPPAQTAAGTTMDQSQLNKPKSFNGKKSTKPKI